MSASNSEDLKRKNAFGSKCEKKLKLSDNSVKRVKDSTRKTRSLKEKIEILDEWNKGNSHRSKSQLGKSMI